MMVMCDGSDITRYDKRKSELSNVPVHITQDNDSIEKQPLKPISNLHAAWTALPLALSVSATNPPV